MRSSDPRPRGGLRHHPAGRRLLAAAGIVAALILGAGVSLVARADRQEAFPHEEHARLFPLCTGCHEGVPDGDVARYYPEPQLCARCHDGAEQSQVTWTGPERHPDNLDFTHPEHFAEAPDVACETCHTPEGSARMTVEHAVVGQCLDCHAHEAENHYVDADCETCHVPAARAELAAQAVLNFPEPDDHELTGFLAELHGDLAVTGTERCATCHVRQRCAACHVNAGQVAAIQAIPEATGQLAGALPIFGAQYPVPASHLQTDWIVEHGGVAAVAECSTCHTKNDCEACHRVEQPAVVAALPQRTQVAAPGVVLETRAPPSHLTAFFEQRHGSVAAAEPAGCTTCHARTFCSDCHDAQQVAAGVTGAAGSVWAGDDGPAFHPPNFAARHSADAYGREAECASCHDNRLFCRDCHTQLGMEAVGRLGRGFHDAEPLWLLRHGQAARQALESCTTCHQQRDCMQCHSTLGAFQISPHGKDFDAERAQSKNPRVCFACHTSNPVP